MNPRMIIPFYERTNALARAMDPGRQTGGTRYIQRSELLEDVYTYNGFYPATGKNGIPAAEGNHRAGRAVPYL